MFCWTCLAWGAVWAELLQPWDGEGEHLEAERLAQPDCWEIATC